jgi:hypothetical protein
MQNLPKQVQQKSGGKDRNFNTYEHATYSKLHNQKAALTEEAGFRWIKEQRTQMCPASSLNQRCFQQSVPNFLNSLTVTHAHPPAATAAAPPPPPFVE